MDNVLSVTELTNSIKEVLENNFTIVRVEGELSNVKMADSGHLYFSLKDEKSVLSGAMFKGKISAAKRNGGLDFEIKDGLAVIVSGSISVFNKRGSYQIYADDIQLKGKGNLQEAFEKLIKKYQEKGWITVDFKKNPDKTRWIPDFPSKIGVVTSPTGAAIRDIVNVITRRFSGVNVLLFPSLVQGENAAESIAQGIRVLNQFDDIDVLIVGRGGGSIEDLWAFNEEAVIKEVYKSRIPVISAVGHEINFTLSDMVADLRAPTPSAAAELVISNKEEIIEKIESIDKRLYNSLISRLNNLKQRMDRLTVDRLSNLLMKTYNYYLQLLDMNISDLKRNFSSHLENKKNRLNTLSEKLSVLNPKSILKRGYSITYDKKDRKIIKDSGNVQKGMEIEIQLYKGRVNGTIDEVL